MDHLTEPIERLRGDADDFAADERLRLLEITADQELLEAAFETLRALEWSPGHRRALFILDVPGEADVASAWARAIATRHAALRDAFGKAGVALPEAPDGSDREPIMGLALVLHRAASALSHPPAPTAGILVIARATEDGWAMIEQLLDVPSLTSIKWCVLSDSTAPRKAKRRRPRPEWWRHLECLIDRARQREELDDLLSALATSPDEAVGPLAAGGAGPAVAPPRHPTDPPAPTEATSTPAREVLVPFFAAVGALRKGDAHAAIAAQRQALDRALAASNVPLAVEMEALLATYAVAAAEGDVRQLGPALKVYERAAERARSAGLTGQAAKLDLLLGVVAKRAGELELAGQALRRCADAACDAAPALAIEALRTAADFLIEVKAPKRAVPLLEEALAIADGMPASEAVQTSASLCASNLASLLRAQRLEARALNAEAAARRLARPTGGPTAGDTT